MKIKWPQALKVNPDNWHIGCLFGNHKYDPKQSELEYSCPMVTYSVNTCIHCGHIEKRLLGH